MKKNVKRFTLRIPNRLYRTILNKLDESDIHKSLNSFVLECVEKTTRKTNHKEHTEKFIKTTFDS